MAWTTGASSTTVDEILEAVSQHSRGRRSSDLDAFAQQLEGAMRAVLVAGPAHVENAIEDIMKGFEPLRKASCDPEALELEALTYVDDIYRQLVAIAVRRFPP